MGHLRKWEYQIEFYANDTLGHLGFAKVTVIKDIDPPIIDIINPINNEIFGVITPSFNTDIADQNMDTMWYTLDEGLTNVTFTINGSIDSVLWNAILDGTVVLKIFANDTAGNINFGFVNIIKDSAPPVITIISPISNEVYIERPPDFNISIIEDDVINTTWYVIQGSITQYPFTGTIGTIDQDAWNIALEGQINIVFYAQDRAGNIGTETIIIIKGIPTQPSIPGYNIFLLYTIVFFALIITLQKKQIRK